MSITSVVFFDRYIDGDVVKTGNNIALVRLPYLATTWMVKYTPGDTIIKLL